MNTTEYGKMVYKLFKDPNDILYDMSAERLNLVHAVMGLAGESGEVLDLVKKHAMTGKHFERDALIKELGDVEFYMEAVRQAVGVSREEVLLGNMEKLSGVGGRYEHGYSDAACQARVDQDES